MWDLLMFKLTFTETVTVEGNGTVANLLKRLFRPYEDNEVVLDSFSSNLGGLKKKVQAYDLK